MTRSWLFPFLIAWVVFAPPAFAIDLHAEAIVLAPQEGTAPEDVEISRWQARARAAAVKPEVFERLGWAYVAKARRTLDAGYYKLAEKTADAMEARYGVGAESQLLRGHVLHNLHRFGEAESIARELVTRRGGPADLALLSDALMEEGKLAEAIEALQRLVNLKPGTEAYSRIAHVRWLKGDLPGAIAMMEAAVRAGSPRDGEVGAWTMSRLASYHLQSGQPALALSSAETALKQVADFPPALFARGRALVALEKKEDAVGALRRAADLNPLPEYQWWLADALRAVGREDEARNVESQLRERGEVADPRTLAIFLATRREDPVTAVRLARTELENRGDVFSHDAFAWALQANGKLALAEIEMQRALAEQTKDARLWLHAGVIARACGRLDEARKFLADAAAASGTLTPSERVLLAAQTDESRIAPAEGIFSSEQLVNQSK